VLFFDYEKRALGLFWGLFILLTINLSFADNIEINGRGGMLLYRDDGQITFWNSGISCKYGSALQKELNFLKVNSGMPWFSTDIFLIDYSAKLDFNAVRPKITAGLISSSDIETISGRAKITNDGANGFYIGSSAGFDIQKFEITPSLFFAKMEFGPGSFYHFYGKPDMPGLMRFGLSAEYDKTHRIGITYDKLDLKILNNSDVPLFKSDNYSAGINYRYSHYTVQNPWKFYVISGFNYADLFVDGALTAANQQYFLFPYAFYNVTGDANAFIGWAMVSLDISGKYLNHAIKAGAGNVFYGELSADAHYRYRPRIFHNNGGREAAEAVKINLAQTGIVFGAYSIESQNQTVKDRIHIYAGLQKILGGYRGMDKFTDVNKEEPKESASKKRDWESLAKTVLLSGLSGNLRITF